VHSLGTAPNSIAESASLGSTVAVPSFANGATHVARILSQSNFLSIFVDDLQQPVLVVPVDLSTWLSLDQGRAWVGFTGATGGLAEVHDLLAWSYDETPQSGSNQPPFAPQITEPAVDGQIVNPADVHMETGPFQDPDGNQHFCTDWEIWTVAPSQRVWFTACIQGLEKLHTHLGDGVFENSHAGRTELFPNTDYFLRVRHRDDSGAANSWSPFAQRSFHAGSASSVFPLEADDIDDDPAPTWRFASGGAPVILPPAGTQPKLTVETPTGAFLLTIEANDGIVNTVINPAGLAAHDVLRLRINGGSQGLSIAASDLAVFDDHCERHVILVPSLAIAPGAAKYLWISASGATYNGTSAQTSPVFTSLARGLDPPWDVRQPGFRVEVFAQGLQLPVNLAFVPNAGPAPGDPFLYVTELYGKIRVVSRDGTVGTYASNLLNFNPTGAFPGSGEQGLAGIAVDPATGDVYAGMLYAYPPNPSAHFPKIVRFTSLDGGHTAATQTTILDMVGESQGQSHQISNLTIAPDGTLFCHMGDGFTTATAQNLDSFRGKILRLELSGAPAASNPFYDPSNGINSRDYVFASGVRNPFGGEWRALDASQYVVENGPSVDRFAKIVAGQNYLWNGTDASMSSFALYNWNPSHGPVNLAFVQPETFGGSGFPASSMGHAFVTESGPTYGTGPQDLGKRISEWVLDANGALVAGPLPFLEYAGVGKATACGLEAGPDGLYMSELYFDTGTGATLPGARILRISYDPSWDCNANGVPDACDIADGTSSDGDGNGVPDECDCAGVRYCSAKINGLGCVPAIGSTGSATLGGPDDFVVLATNVRNKKQGLAMWSSSTAATPFGGGTLCLGPPVRRMPVTNSAGSPSGNDCTGTYVRPISDAFMAAQGWVAGTTAHFQFWSRDPGYAPPNNIGLTDALRVVVCP
jgi:glucose/arabinose dehydrogenase